MAKTRAQRKAERRAREEQEKKRSADGRADESRAQHDTQVPISGDVAEIEAVEAGMGAGAPESEPRDPRRAQAEPRPRSGPRQARQGSGETQAGRAKRREREQLTRSRNRRRPSGSAAASSASCLLLGRAKKVQWPDRDTLVQATAVTIIFVAVAGAYLGALDAVFNYLVKQIL